MHTIEWAAGLFEGEGCISKEKRYNSAYLELGMTDKDVVEQFRDVVGYGNIKEQYRVNRKPFYRIKIGKKEEVIRILSAMLPYFGNRRAHKALDILDYIECN